jgi:hypothetical protein
MPVGADEKRRESPAGRNGKNGRTRGRRREEVTADGAWEVL